MSESILPSDFIVRLKDLYPSDWSEIVAVLQTGRPTTFRVNTLKISVAIAVAELSHAGFELSQASLDNAFVLQNKTIRELEEHPLYQDGALYVQGLSSMIPALLLDPQPGESILDCAAAPGSKTTQMAALMNNEGMILANDTSRIRLFKLKANLEKQGVTNVHVRQGMGQHLWQDFPEVFDRVLVDVPCSMEGRFRADRPKTIADWSVRKIKELSERQKFMLLAAVSCARPGGRIVYSTCTLAPEENEAVISWLLKKTKGAVVVEEPKQLPITMRLGLTTWHDSIFDEQVKKTQRILPTKLYEGFYVAVLKKVRSNL
ncbi:RsmB/NOP family class I SAM-dependent RNA methyltransferase [Candidatus Woesebacteria bacterium]|nr:RsmB/NOP family class I SAM-dependent RNA methyltransferase [Candidatus Woesebacteria bacterium]